MTPIEKIVVSRPCYDTYEYENVVTVSRLMSFTSGNGYLCFNHFTKGSNIAKLREQAVAVAKTAKADRILWVDSDMLVMEDSLLKLIKCEKDIVSGVAVTKQPPFGFLISRKDETGKPALMNSLPSESLFTVDAVGFGFMLVKTSVFDKIEAPYFQMNNDTGEDYYFCEKAIQAGLEVWVNSDCQVGHIGQYVYTIDDNINCKPSLIVDTQGRSLIN